MIIGITGHRQNGKSTAAKILMKHYPQFKLVSFPLPLKKVACKMFDISLDKLEETKDSYALLFDNSGIYIEYKISVRRILQELGDFARQIDPEFFIKQAEKSLLEDPYTVIADVRFINEAEMIRKNGGIIIKVERKMDTNDDQHSTEIEVDSIPTDYIIQNNDTIEHFERQLLKHYHHILD